MGSFLVLLIGKFVFTLPKSKSVGASCYGFMLNSTACSCRGLASSSHQTYPLLYNSVFHFSKDLTLSSEFLVTLHACTWYI